MGSGGVTLLNEASSKCFSTSAAYVHVDDRVLLSDGSATQLHSNALLDATVRGLEDLGFDVTQQVRHDSLEKVVGYEVMRTSAAFCLPLKKQVLLRDALLLVASKGFVQIDVLCSLTGM